MKYGQFILLVRQICRTAGRDLGLKTMYAVEISLISVAIVSIGFISEAILCVEYMQGKRLALVKADPAISALFALFSIMKCKFIFLKNSNRVRCVFPVVLVSLLPDAGLRPNSHRENALHFNLWPFLQCFYYGSNGYFGCVDGKRYSMFTYISWNLISFQLKFWFITPYQLLWELSCMMFFKRQSKYFIFQDSNQVHCNLHRLSY